MKKYLLSVVLAFCAWMSNAQTVPSYVPLTSLLAWYPFTGNAVDSSGNGNDGTVHGAALTTDRFGNPGHAYFYNGSSSYISTAFLPPTGNAARTITSWFKYNSLPDLCGDKGLCIVGYGGNDRGCFEACKNFSLEIEYTSYPPTARVDGICILTQVLPVADSVDTNWHFFAAVYDSSYGDFRDIKIYLDGLFDTTITTIYGGSSAMITDRLSKLQIGAGHYDCQRFFDGKIDDIGVWSRALSECELHGLYRGADCSTLEVGTQPISVPGQITIYPNPASNELDVSATEKISNVAIFNLLGQMISSHECGRCRLHLDIGDLPPGAYFLNVNGTAVRTFVKK